MHCRKCTASGGPRQKKNEPARAHPRVVRELQRAAELVGGRVVVAASAADRSALQLRFLCVRARKTWAKHRDNLTPLDGARQRIRAKTSQLTCEQGSPYDPTGVRHVPPHSDIAPRARWIVACQACRLSGFSGATQTPTSAVSRVHTVIDTAKK